MSVKYPSLTTVVVLSTKIDVPQKRDLLRSRLSRPWRLPRSDQRPQRQALAMHALPFFTQDIKMA